MRRRTLGLAAVAIPTLMMTYPARTAAQGPSPWVHVRVE